MSFDPELIRLGRAARDPAIAFLLLFPLALLHLSGGASSGNLVTFSVGLQGLAWLGDWSVLVLGVVLLLGVVWAIGRIQALDLPWAGGSILLIVEGLFWGFVRDLLCFISLSICRLRRRHFLLLNFIKVSLWPRVLDFMKSSFFGVVL